MNVLETKINQVRSLLNNFYSIVGPERVGFIYDGDSGIKIQEVNNVSPEPFNSFIVSAEDIIQYVTEVKAWATFHTHPNQDGNLSGEDYRMFLNYPELIHFIVGNDGVRVYSYNEKKKAIMELD